MKVSAGLLMYRYEGSALQVLLAHPGGPFFRNKDHGAWSIPKGEVGADEQPRVCALREFHEETGIRVQDETLVPLGEITQRGGKRVHAWACRAPTDLTLQDPPPSNTFELEWPPRSGKRATFPEIDKLAFFALPEAREKLLAAQVELLERLEVTLARTAG